MRLPIRILGLLAAAAAIGPAQAATPLLSEGFDDVSALAGAGWVLTNASAMPDQPWSQGNVAVFTAHAGAADSYAAASFLSTGTVSGAISNWLITPQVEVWGGETLSFVFRTEAIPDFSFADSLLVKLSATGSAATGAFDTTLLSIPVAPTAWTVYSVALPLLGGPTLVRIGFEYGLASALDANYVGLDSVTLVPEPASAILLGLGLAGLAIRRRASARGETR